jgi:hypothetical protein
MKNLKKSMALVAAIAMSASMLAGCNTTQDPAATDAGTTAEVTMATAAETQPAAADLDTAGKELVFYGWNEELKGFVETYYLADNPLPEGVTWAPLITTGTQEYQNKTDAQLAADATSAAADKIDFFGAEFNYMSRYVNIPYTMPLTSLGLTQAELDTQIPYTLGAGITTDGVYKAISFQSTPLLMFYRASIAEKVLGSSDPAVVGEAMKDWPAFEATAAKMKDAGVKMMHGPSDIFYQFANASGEAIVATGSEKITVPAKWTEWVTYGKKLADDGLVGTGAMWGGDWTTAMADGSTFCFSGPAWFINFTMADAVKGTDAYGDYRATTGPVGTLWGGTWMFAGASTDNGDLVADIMRYMCTDTDTAASMAIATQNTPSNAAAFASMAAGGPDLGLEILGGQNPYDIYAKAAESIDANVIAKEMSIYGGLCETYQAAYVEYFQGVIDEATALENFYTNALTAYSNLQR